MIHLKTFEKFKFKSGKKSVKKITSDIHNKGGAGRIMRNVDRKMKYSLYNIDKLSKLLKDVAKRFGVKKVKYMDAGTFGMAFIADDDKVIKLTSAEGEGAFAKSIINKDKPGCIKYYDVVYLDDYKIWVILMDRAESLTKEEEIIYDLIEGKNLKPGNNIFKKGIADEMGIKVFELEEYIKRFDNLLKKLKRSKISTNDLHTGNIGKIKGELVHFDVMDYYTGKGVIKKISKI